MWMLLVTCRPTPKHHVPMLRSPCCGIAGAEAASCPAAEAIPGASGALSRRVTGVGTLDLRVKHPSTGEIAGCYSPCSKRLVDAWAVGSGPQVDVAQLEQHRGPGAYAAGRRGGALLLPHASRVPRRVPCWAREVHEVRRGGAAFPKLRPLTRRCTAAALASMGVSTTLG